MDTEGAATSTAMDTEQPTVGGSGATLVATFLEQLGNLPQNEKEQAFIDLRNGLPRSDRYLLRRTLEVNAPDELTPEVTAAVVAEEMKQLAAAMKEKSKSLSRPGCKGAKGLVTADATLVDVDWDKDTADKRAVAPTLMAMLEAALKSKHWYYDKKLMTNFIEKASAEVEHGNAKVVDGRLLRVARDDSGNEFECEESELKFNYHKRPWSFSAVKIELEQRSGSLMACLAIISDILVASRTSGQEIITPLLLRLSIACTQMLTRPSYDLLSSLKLILPRTNAIAVTDEAARLYDDAFPNDVVVKAKETANRSGILVENMPYAVGMQVDNYVKGYGVLRHLLGGGASNFHQTPTETRMFGFCRSNMLEPGDGGYGEEYNHARVITIFGRANVELLSDTADSIWSFKDTVIASSTNEYFGTFMLDGLLPDGGGAYRLRDHALAPQVEACSASRKDFKTHVIDWAKMIFGFIWCSVHLFFVFDTEYIPHYMSWLMRCGEAKETMKNTAVLPCKFHIRKHLSETFLARKKILQFIMVPLLLKIFVTSTKKWKEVGRQAEKGFPPDTTPLCRIVVCDVTDKVHHTNPLESYSCDVY